MNFGSTVKKLATEFNLMLRINKPFEGFKPNLCQGASGVSKSSSNNDKSDSHKSDLENIKSIIQPVDRKIVNVELPLRNTIGGALDLPCNVEKEIVEPVGNVISKKALNIIRIRKRKMRIHQRRKYRKKHRFERAKILQKRSMEKEIAYQATLKALLNEGESFSAEKYAKEVIDKVNWTPPVTKVYGRLAPSWVIKEHLERERVKQIMKERIEYCQSLKKNN